MKITIIVATFNGEDTLAESLESLNRIQTDSIVELSIVYVDNNSTDNTSNILNQFECKFPFYSLKQTKKGKNAALNTVFEYPEYLGDLLIFSDDDVIFPSDFVSRYVSVASQFQNIKIFGGRIDAKWPQRPSDALINGIDKVVAFAITPEDWGYETGLIDPVKIHGPNMAISKELFAEVLFNESIGPNGENYMMGSETELLFQLKSKGLKAYFDFDNAPNKEQGIQ